MLREVQTTWTNPTNNHPISAFENLYQRDDADLVYVATPWEWHAAMAVCAMNSGNHVAIEVPAAITLHAYWDLVDASERTAETPVSHKTVRVSLSA